MPRPMMTSICVFTVALAGTVLAEVVNADPTVSLTKTDQGATVVVINGANCDQLPSYVTESELRKMASQLSQLIGCDIGKSINKSKAAKASSFDLRPKNGGGGIILKKDNDLDLMLMPMTPSFE